MSNDEDDRGVAGIALEDSKPLGGDLHEVRMRLADQAASALLLGVKLPCAECNELAARAKAEGKWGYVVCARCRSVPASIPSEKIAEGDEGVFVEGGDGADPRIVAYNEGGYNSTSVSVLDVLKWVRERRPDLLK